GHQQHRAEVLARPDVGRAFHTRREQGAVRPRAGLAALVGEVGVDVPPEPVEVAGPVGTPGALVLGQRDAGQDGPEAAQGPGGVVHLLLRDRAPEQIVRAQRFAGELDLRADLERARTAPLEVPLEADVPDDPLLAHRAISAEIVAPGKFSAPRAAAQWGPVCAPGPACPLP